MQVNEPGQPKVEQVGEHPLEDDARELLSFIYDFQQKLPLAINHFFAKRFGYDPDVRPVGFQVDFKGGKVRAYSPEQSRQQRRASKRKADKKGKPSPITEDDVRPKNLETSE